MRRFPAHHRDRFCHFHFRNQGDQTSLKNKTVAPTKYVMYFKAYWSILQIVTVREILRIVPTTGDLTLTKRQSVIAIHYDYVVVRNK